MDLSALNILLTQLGLKETVFFRNKKGGYCDVLHSDIQNRLDTINPDAIYVFNNKPLILFFDLTDNTIADKEGEIHKKVWSFDNSPIIFIIKNTEISVYNALNYIKEEGCLQKIELSKEEIIAKFSFWNLQSNSVWKWFQESYIAHSKRKETKKRANECLFQNIKSVRNALVDKENDPEGCIPNSLILRLIFIRYLIDRDINIDVNFIHGESISSRRKSFSELIADNVKLCQLFSKLNDRFNGVLFKDVDIEIPSNHAKALSNIFAGETPEVGTLFYGSDYYFDIFDFSIIPVEVISGIYESLIDPETRDLQSAVYTPPFLVEYILNDTIDIYLSENKTSDCKVFEVAVGSGIFLVQALRRMIDSEILLNGNSDKEAFSKRIRDIAKDNLYGVDINKEALKVTCFSIYIALLDYQEPRDINTYKFPNLLNENLFEANFFDTNHQFNQIVKKIKPQYILGNPPWKSNKDVCHTNWLRANKKTVGGFEIAQSFLLRTKDFMDVNTHVALIVTSTMFYNVSNTTRKFKTEFLSTYCISKFLDLSPVRRLIFEKKDSPASIVYYRLSQNDEYKNNVVCHYSIKANYFLKHFKMLVLEKYDQKRILQSYFLKNDWMFKIALYGNTLDFRLLEKINKNEVRLSNYVDNKLIFGGAGILKGTPKRYWKFLEGLCINENQEVKQYYTPNSLNTLDYRDTYLESGRTLNIFNGSKILFKEQAVNESELCISYNDSTSVFKKGVFGLCSTDDHLIKTIYGYLISDLYTYYIFYISGSWATSTRPQIRWKEEYLSFPLVTSTKTAAKIELLTSQFIKSYQDFYQEFQLGEPVKPENIQAQINEIICNIYGINEYEKDLIDYALKVSRYQFQHSKLNLITDFSHNEEDHYRNQQNVLRKYAEVFLGEFDQIYESEHVQANIYVLEHFIAVNFVFNSKSIENKVVFHSSQTEESDVLVILAKSLSISTITNSTDPTKNIFIQKDIKGFEENSFYIIKPKEYKCWHRAIAWHDVAEVKALIEDAEVIHFNDNIYE